MTAYQYAGGFAMLVTALCLVTQAVIVRGKNGWKYRPWYNRAAMGGVAAILASRAVTVLHGGIVLNSLGVVLSIGMALWQLLEVMRVVTESWRDKAGALELDRDVGLTPDAPLPPYTRFRRPG